MLCRGEEAVQLSPRSRPPVPPFPRLLQLPKLGQRLRETAIDPCGSLDPSAPQHHRAFLHNSSGKPMAVVSLSHCLTKS